MESSVAIGVPRREGGEFDEGGMVSDSNASSSTMVSVAPNGVEEEEDEEEADDDEVPAMKAE